MKYGQRCELGPELRVVFLCSPVCSTEDPGGIAYFGYAYYSSFASQLTTVRIASDRKRGVQDTSDAKVEPSTYTITDGSYSVFKRKLYVTHLKADF